MSRANAHAVRILILVLSAALVSGCVARTAVKTTSAVTRGAVKVTGAVACTAVDIAVKDPRCKR